jgi:GR25 family glycosyltransferase involved in LPS biosynthesis
VATKIYVVSLASAKERRSFMRKQLESCRIPFEFVEAIDAGSLEKGFVNDVNLTREYPNELKPGEIACAMSHEKACRRFLADPSFQNAVVMEDDVIIGAHLARVVVELEDRAPPGCATLLYAPVYSPLRFTPLAPLGGNFHHVAADPARNIFGTQAYFLSRKTAERLCQGFTPVVSIADDWARYLREGRLESLRLVFPFPVLHAEFLSAVNRASGATSIRTIIKQFVYENQVFPFFQLFLMMRRSTAERRQRRHIRFSGSLVKKTYRLR